MEDGGKGGYEDRSNVTGMVDALQVSRSDGAAIWDKYICGEGGHFKINRVIPSSGSHNDCREDTLTYDGRRVGISLSGQHTRYHRVLANQGIHPAEAGHLHQNGGLPDHI